jgi:hypothetical protein
VAVGTGAGYNTQGVSAIAIGNIAGNLTQGLDAIAIGNSAGATNQGAGAIAMGYHTGFLNQGIDSIVIGNSSGTTGVGSRNIMFGTGNESSFDECIVLGNGITTLQNNTLSLGSLSSPLVTNAVSGGQATYLVVQLNGSLYKIPIHFM